MAKVGYIQTLHSKEYIVSFVLYPVWQLLQLHSLWAIVLFSYFFYLDGKICRGY